MQINRILQEHKHIACTKNTHAMQTDDIFQCTMMTLFPFVLLLQEHLSLVKNDLKSLGEDIPTLSNLKVTLNVTNLFVFGFSIQCMIIC